MNGVCGALLSAFAIGALLGHLLLPVLHRLKFGQNVYELAPETHQKKQGTPTMGGVVIAGAALIAALLFSTAGSSRISCLAAMFLLSFGNMAIGLADDLTKIRRKKNGGLTPRQKMIPQAAMAVAFSIWCAMSPEVGTAIRIPFASMELDLGWLYVPVMVFVIVGTTNSANLLDGLDGLLTSSALPAFLTLAILALAAGLDRLGVGCAAFAGACMAFLLYNAYPAAVFMGDTGSMLIGGAVASAAIILRQPLLLILIGFWMMMSSVSDLIQFAYFRATHGRRIFRMAPIHHHFELGGMKETKIVAMYMTTTIALCVLALLGALN